MKVLITDYPDVLGRDLSKEIAVLKQYLGAELEVEVFPYVEQKGLIKAMEGVDGVLTAFVPYNSEVIAACPDLKAISINATGYNFVDLDAANERGIPVCAIGEYCTDEVADHTFALLLCLERSIKRYFSNIDGEKIWQYYDIDRKPIGLSGSVLGIFGFGKIGRAVARRAKAFGMRIMAFDKYISDDIFAENGVEKVEPDTIFEQADFISNHMVLAEDNMNYFNAEAFAKMRKNPIFINVSRGGHVDEAALLNALNAGKISGAELDVLAEEKPDLKSNPLVGRTDTIITPHSAFYSIKSIEKLQRISCENLAYCLRGESEKAFRVVNSPN